MLRKQLSHADQWQDGLRGVLHKARVGLPESQSSELMLLQGRTAVTQKQSDECINPVLDGRRECGSACRVVTLGPQCACVKGADRVSVCVLGKPV